MDYEAVMKLALERGFYFPSCEVYADAQAGFWEYGPSYGMVSLMVDGEVVSKRSQLFGTGQTQIIFNSNVPTSDGFISYDIQGVVELYDNKITIVPTALTTHPKTITVAASEMPSLEVIQRDGQILAVPASSLCIKC